MNQENFSKIIDHQIRREWDHKSTKWNFSIVDVITLATKSSDPRNYWKVLKNRLKKTHNELVTNCNQLKMLANDGKFYLTDTADQETILEILEIVSSNFIPVFEEFCENLDQKNSTFSKITRKISEFSSEENESYPQMENEIVEEIEDEDMMLMIDGYVEKNFIIIQTFIAGVNTENLSVSTTCDTLTIKGERLVKKENKEENYSEQELNWGKFSRTIKLPQEVDIDEILASEEHGLLTIKLPTINKNRSKQIKVRTL